MQAKCWNGCDITIDKFPDPTKYKCPKCGTVGGLLSEDEYWRALKIQEENYIVGMA